MTRAPNSRDMSTSNVVGSTRIEVLTKDNYDSWCVQAEALLIKNDGWSYVCGETPRPPKPAGSTQEAMEVAMRTWQMADRKAKADLILCLSPAIAQRAGKIQTSKALWEKLKETFASTGPIKKATLLHSLTMSKMSEEEDIDDHLNTFFDVIAKLEAMDINHDELLTTLLLNSLLDSFDNFAGNIRSRDELPSPEVCKIKILEEFERRKSKTKRDEQAMLTAKRYYTHTTGPRYSPNQIGGMKGRKFPFRCSKRAEFGHKPS